MDLRPAVPLFFSLLVAWGLLYIFWPAGAFLWGLGLILLPGGWRQAAVVLAPWVLLPVVHFKLTAMGYAAGTATLMTVGYPGVSGPLIDRTTRAGYDHTGCMVDGSEVFTVLVNNATLHALTAAFGRMDGVYTGPLLDRETALALTTDIALAGDAATRRDLGDGGWLWARPADDTPGVLWLVWVIDADSVEEASSVTARHDPRLVAQYMFEAVGIAEQIEEREGAEAACLWQYGAVLGEDVCAGMGG
ncbi:MAG: hypothetical protein H6739_35670 [Alphaproteobacteria bacterium]|nr:hypothetical protein [Alphaproteobacteria bacterium]